MYLRVDGARKKFINGKLTFTHFDVVAGIGEMPTGISGNLELTEEHGVSENSTEQEVKDIAYKFIMDEAPKEPVPLLSPNEI